QRTEWLIDFMGNRGGHLSQRRHPRDVSQLHLGCAKCLFRALAFDELADLTAQSSHQPKQFLVRLSYLAAEKFDHPQDVSPEQNGKTERCMQSLTGSDRRAQKLGVVNGIRNGNGLTSGPDPAR